MPAVQAISPNVLQTLNPLSSLGIESLRNLPPICNTFAFDRGSNPLQEGDWSEQVVYLLKGELRLDAPDVGMRVLVGGSGRALSPVLHARATPMRSYAITNVELLCIEAEPFDILVTWGQLARQADGAVREQETNWQHMSGMFAVKNLTQGAFAALPPANISQLLERFKRIDVARNQVVVNQGDVGDYYYLIERGRCRVTRAVGGVTMDLAELSEGDAFGEEALVAELARNATVTMRTDGVLLRLAKEDFVTLLQEPLLKKLKFAELGLRVDTGATLIDVRFPAEFQQDGLPGAINVPVNEIRNASGLLEKGDEYIVYCRTGRRSSAAAFLLSQRGIRAWLLDGGLQAMKS